MNKHRITKFVENIRKLNTNILSQTNEKLKKLISNKSNLSIWIKNKNELIKDLKNKSLPVIKLNSPSTYFIRLQDLLENIVSTQSEDVLLEKSNFWAKSITWTLIGGTGIGLIWLSLAKTEEIIVTQGKLEPIQKVIDVQIPLGGVIKEILVKEGEIVEANQILVRLDKEVSQSQMESMDSMLEINETILEKYKFLNEEGAISKIQYLQQLANVADIKSKHTNAKVNLNYTDIKSPIKGIVFEMKPRNSGFVARTSDPILKVVPIDKLRAKVEIDSKSIGFVSTGKKVDISIDSFPATDFGVVKGIVKSIGSDALSPNPQLGKGYRFPAIITLDTQELKLKNGETLPLQVGMSLTANIKLRKVSYIQLLLGTFQDKADALRSL